MKICGYCKNESPDANIFIEGGKQFLLCPECTTLFLTGQLNKKKPDKTKENNDQK